MAQACHQRRDARESTADAAGATPRAIYFGDTRLSGPTRLTLQIDMTATDWNSGTACSIRCWINRQEIAVNHNAPGSYGIGGATGPSFKPGDNLKFATNYFAPFNIGASTPAQTQWCNPERTCDRGDFTLYGLAISSTALYESDADGVGGGVGIRADLYLCVIPEKPVHASSNRPRWIRVSIP